MLHNMRHNLAGTSYKDASDAMGLTTGCPDANPRDGATTEDCIGYELMSDLDFDTDGDGDGTWTGSGGTYTLDAGDNQTPYFIAASGGWEPIGVDNTAPFTAIFEGNGYVIRNLAIQRNQTFIGLFGAVTGTIRNLGLEQALADKTGSSASATNIGLLAGWMGGGNIINSYVTGVAAGDTSDNNFVGGLVGRNNGGTITASYAHASLFGEGGTGDGVGGLVGYLFRGDILASYATGAVNGGSGNRSYAGGLVGVMGASGETTRITASYATGHADGGAGTEDLVGGLVGWKRGTSTITTSYATGNTNGGTGNSDSVGRLVGQQIDGTIVSSYGFGTRAGHEADGIDRSQTTTATSAATLTLANAGAAWNFLSRGNLGAWDFGDSNQLPALRYDDYDGTSDDDDNIDHCALFTAVNIPCGTLLPGQRTDTTPQVGTTSSDIQLAEGDIADGVTANILLPSTLTVGDEYPGPDVEPPPRSSGQSGRHE